MLHFVQQNFEQNVHQTTENVALNESEKINTDGNNFAETEENNDDGAY